MTDTITNHKIKDWVNLYSDQMYSFALQKTSRKEIAEDMVQEAFMAAFKSLDKFENKSEPRTWLFSILKNKIADHFRGVYRKGKNMTISYDRFFDENESWRAVEMPADWGNKADEHHLLDDTGFKEVFESCIDELPEQWNASVVLKYIENKPSKEICKELNITPTNYWQIIHRSKLQLRKCLELKWFNNE